MISSCYNSLRHSQAKIKLKTCTRLCIVVTTCWNGTCSILTSVKLTEGYLVVEITRELDKEPLLYCFSIYTTISWSMLQQYLLALMSICLPHILLLIHYKTTILYTCVLMSYSLISAIYICTMCIL